MTARFALDTNILVYALSEGSDPRHQAAFDLVARALACHAIVPVQVLGEFLNVCRNKNVLAPEEALRRVVEWLPLFATPTTRIEHLVEAAGLSGRYGLALFDAVICAVAIGVGAGYLLSEDMQDGLMLPDLTIVNPFVPRNARLVEQLLGDMGDAA